MAKANFTWVDYDGEKGSTSINLPDLTSLNFDGEATKVTALRSAMNGLTLANVSKAMITDVNWNNLNPVLDPNAQREIKYIVIVSDINNNKYRAMEIPIANLNLLENNSKYLVKGTNIVVPGSTVAVQAFITAFQDAAKDRFGNALSVWDISQAGRNT